MSEPVKRTSWPETVGARVVLGLVVVALLFAVGILGCEVSVKPAAAAMLRVVYLSRGDTAAARGGETTCVAQPHGGSRLGFVCRVGGDYRARYGVVVNEREVLLVEYVSAERYRVVVRRRQSPLP